MGNKRVRLVVIFEAEIEDPLAVKTSRLETLVDGETGQVSPVTWDGREGLEWAVGLAIMKAATERMDAIDGLTSRSAIAHVWPPQPDGSYSSLTLPGSP